MTLIGVVYFFKPHLWLWKNAALYVATRNPSGSTSSAALSARDHWYKLTREDAMGAVRQFWHAPNLAVHSYPSQSPTISGSELSTPRYRSAYSLTDGKYTYLVNQRCADWLEFQAKAGSYDHAPQGVASLFSAAKVEKIALRFVREHYPHPETLSYWHSTGSGDRPTMYTQSLVFHEVDPDATWGPGWCNIEVDRVDGRVISYYQKYFPILVSKHAQITPVQAVKKVEDLMIIRFTEQPKVTLMVSEPDEQGREHLYYAVSIFGSGVKNPFTANTYDVDVDARDGSIYRWRVL